MSAPTPTGQETKWVRFTAALFTAGFHDHADDVPPRSFYVNATAETLYDAVMADRRRAFRAGVAWQKEQQR